MRNVQNKKYEEICRKLSKYYGVLFEHLPKALVVKRRLVGILNNFNMYKKNIIIKVRFMRGKNDNLFKNFYPIR